MIYISIRLICLLVIFFLNLFSPCLAQEEFSPYPGVIHIHSNVSHGAIYSSRQLASLAQDKGIKILVFTDTFLRRWEYGLPIFSNIFKVSKQEQSVVTYGIKNYLQDLKKIQDEFSDVLILDGTEVKPFYWWSGSPFKKNLLMNDGNRDLLVIGLGNYKHYAHLPLVFNRYFLPQFKDIPPLLICASLIISGIFLLKKKKRRKFFGVIITAVGVLFLFDLFPFSSSRYRPYHGDKYFSPHQDLINYVNKKGGLVFWSLPEVAELASLGKFASINYYTPSYPESLVLTSGYTGFGVHMQPGTNSNLILAGNEWDKVLMGYCKGERARPAWIIGEADYRGSGQIDSVQNIFFLNELNPESVHYALANGRLYTRYYSENKIDISLSDFHIEDSQGNDKFAFIAEEIEIKGKPLLRIKGNCISNPPQNLKIDIIRNGEIIKKFEFSDEGAFDLEFSDDSLQASSGKSYYRLNFFLGECIILVANPIFVEIKNG